MAATSQSKGEHDEQRADNNGARGGNIGPDAWHETPDQSKTGVKRSGVAGGDIEESEQ